MLQMISLIRSYHKNVALILLNSGVKSLLLIINPKIIYGPKKISRLALRFRGFPSLKYISSSNIQLWENAKVHANKLTHSPTRRA